MEQILPLSCQYSEDIFVPITGQRVLDVEGPMIETSFATEGKYKGEEGNDIGTYCTIMREGVMYGEGQEVIVTKDGKEVATWTGQGIGRFTGPGKMSFRGSLFFSTTSTDGGKLSFLKNLVGVFEYEVDEQGNASSKVWEWKEIRGRSAIKKVFLRNLSQHTIAS